MELFVVDPNSNTSIHDRNIQKVKVPIFDTQFTVEIENEPEQTVDWNLLRTLTPAVKYSIFESQQGYAMKSFKNGHFWSFLPIFWSFYPFFAHFCQIFGHFYPFFGHF